MAHVETQQLGADHQHPNSFSFPHPLSIRSQPHDTGIPSVTGGGQYQGQWDDVPPPVGNGAAQGTPWNSHHANVGDYRTADYYPELAGDHTASPYTHPNVGPAHQQGIPEHMQIMFHDNPGNGHFGHVPEGVAPVPVPVPDPSRAAFSSSSAHRATYHHGQPVAENLRRLASRYVHHPNSQVDMVRMEPGSAGRYKVVIVLEMEDFL